LVGFLLRKVIGVTIPTLLILIYCNDKREIAICNIEINLMNTLMLIIYLHHSCVTVSKGMVYKLVFFV